MFLGYIGLYCDYLDAGEQFHIIVHISVHHPEGPGIITPYKVAAAIEKGLQSEDDGSDSMQDPARSSQDYLPDATKIKTPKLGKSSLKGKWFNTTPGGNLVAVSEWLDEQQAEDNVVPSESQKRRTAMLLESFQNSHFHVKIGERADGSGSRLQDAIGKADQPDLSDEEGSDRESSATAYGCRPVVTEDGKFEPLSAGGLARGSASCWSLQNGDVVVSYYTILCLPMYNMVHRKWNIRVESGHGVTKHVSLKSSILILLL